MFITNGYGGLNWGGFSVINGASQPGTIYQTGMVSSPNVAIANRAGAYITHWLGFKLHSIHATGIDPVYGSEFRVLGEYNGGYVYDNRYTVSTTNPTFINLNQGFIDQASIFDNSGIAPFIIDNLTLKLPPVNYWTNSDGGHWRDSFWSFGTIPNDTQSVAIANPQEKTIIIDSLTAQNYPASMTVNDLLVDGPNTLLLNSGSNAMPFSVNHRLVIGTGGTLNLASGRLAVSGIRLNGGTLRVGDGNHNLRQLTLSAPILFSSSMSQIEFSGTNTMLLFTNFAAAVGATLVVSNWSGSLSGGGAVRLYIQGLSIYELDQITFRNPAGLPPGDYPAKLIGNEIVPVPFNSWTKSTDGNWADSFWSLGILPDNTQSVLITNGGQKSVSITTDTANNYPSSLRVNELTLSGTSTLLLDHVSSPFLVNDGLTVNAGATVSNLSSALIAGGTTGPAIRLNGGQIFQDGGLVEANSYSSFAGDYYLMSGEADFGFILQSSGTFNQYGGSASVSLICDGGSFQLHDGQLVLGLDPDLSCSFVQDGGTNYIITGRYGAAGLHLHPFDVLDHFPRNLTLNGGYLFTDNADIGWAGNFGQNGGTAVITNTMEIYGSGDSRGHPVSWTFGRYSKSNGLLSAREIEISSHAASFWQGDGITTVSDSIQFVGNSYAMVSSFGVGGGTVTCSNLLYAGGTVDLIQSGGDLVVSNLLLFGGYFVGYQYYGYIIPPRFARYDFSDGTLVASNIEIDAEWIIGSSAQVGRIANPGYCQMGGILDIGDANEQLGRFILSSNALINFTGSSTKLSFANSSAETWSPVTLSISNWNGSLNGGGNEQLKFGTNASGLSASQLKQIRFINPAGFPNGLYLAKMLNTGEVVPYATSLAFSQTGNDLVLSWTDSNFVLQTATNVAGPYLEVPDAASPYTNVLPDTPQRFFRVQRAIAQ